MCALNRFPCRLGLRLDVAHRRVKLTLNRFPCRLGLRLDVAHRRVKLSVHFLLGEIRSKMQVKP